ncbi:MAG: HAD-IA family hydrolase [Thermoanaerobaculia bacterium]|nr:HAD-IA family hydrolase [Thermoanaerobaculia bacterium]
MTLPYRSVLFDLDGTLVDSYAALAEAVNFARREHGYDELGENTIRRYVGEGLERLLQRAFTIDDVPKSVRESFERRYDQICCEQSRILDDVEVTLAELSAAGIVMAVCTNKPTAFSRKILDFLKLAPYFRAIVGPDLAGARKPDGQHVLRTLEHARCEADGTLFVGDMPIDVQAARNGGVDVAVVATGSASHEELVRAQPDHMLDRFSDLLRLVGSGAAV